MKTKIFNKIVPAIALIILGIWIGYYLFSDINGYFTNLYTEIISIFVTVLIVDRLAAAREQSSQIKERQQQLIIDAGSSSNEAAKRALAEMWRRGWRNFLLKGAGLSAAQWEGAHFGEADLSNAELFLANLKNTDARFVNFSGANLEKANLEGMLIRMTHCSTDTTLPSGEKCQHDAQLILFGAKLYPPTKWYHSDWSVVNIDPDTVEGEIDRIIRGIKPYYEKGMINSERLIKAFSLTECDVLAKIKML